MGNMREISVEECNAVFGGSWGTTDEVDPIIVTGTKKYYDSLSDNMFSYGGLAGYDTLTSFAAGDFVYDQVQTTLARILNALFDLELKTDAERKANEEKVSSEFNPDNVVTEGKMADKPTWTTNDGVTWVDTNKNGSPDYKIKFDRSGVAYGDDGSGWKKI